MPTNTILLVILAALVSGGLAWLQYFYRGKGQTSQKFIFGGLRFFTFFALLLLLINPKIISTEYFVEKPVLIVAVDNSASISFLNEAENVVSLTEAILEDPELRKRFDLQQFTFGENLNPDSPPEFSESQTNIPEALQQLDKIYQEDRAPIILITDGNQTLGRDLAFAAGDLEQEIIPVVVGDTSAYSDLYIARVNANKYSFLNNEFPVEIFVGYSGEEDVETVLEVSSGNSILFSTPLEMNGTENSAVVTARLTANSVGVQNYVARVRPLSEEKNVENNVQEFAVEVIDERTKVLLLYSVLHPDLGAMKNAIESNQQREAELQHISNFSGIEDYDLILFYQPTAAFANVFQQLQERDQNYLAVTGPETNWNFLNDIQDVYQQEITGQTEEFFPELNENFSAYQVGDIGFSTFPPLTASFGEIKSLAETDVLLSRKIGGVSIPLPMLSFSETAGSKNAYLFGSGIWKWRSQVFQNDGSFEAFDTFFGSIVQYLSQNNRKERLVISYEPLFRGSSEAVITARYFDENYVFDPSAEFSVEVENQESAEVLSIPFMLKENNYEVDLSALPAGEYSFTVRAAGTGLSKSGNFRLLSFDVEKQFMTANLSALQRVAEQKNQPVFFPDQFQQLKSYLLNSENYVPVQKSRQNSVPLIDWYYLLVIIILSLSAEWFLRKYRGLI